MEPLRDCASSLEHALHTFSDNLESARERIEGATRLHQLFGLQLKEDDVLQEMQRLAEKIGKPDLLDRFKHNVTSFNMGSVQSRAGLKIDVKRLFSTSTPERPVHNQQPKLQVKSTSSKPVAIPECQSPDSFISWLAPVNSTVFHETSHQSVSMCKVNRNFGQASSSEGDRSPDDSLVSRGQHEDSLKETDANEEDEEDHSKMADSGLGGCDRCEGQDNAKLKRTCSCQSFEDATMMIKNNDSDDLDEEDDECFRRTSNQGEKSFQPNSHLFSHSSNLNLDLEAEVPGIDQKTQK